MNELLPLKLALTPMNNRGFVGFLLGFVLGSKSNALTHLGYLLLIGGYILFHLLYHGTPPSIPAVAHP